MPAPKLKLTVNIHFEKLKRRQKKIIVLLPVSLQVADVVVSAADAWPVRVSWRDRDQAYEVPVAYLHRLLAADPPLGLAILRG